MQHGTFNTIIRNTDDTTFVGSSVALTVKNDKIDIISKLGGAVFNGELVSIATESDIDAHTEETERNGYTRAREAMLKVIDQQIADRQSGQRHNALWMLDDLTNDSLLAVRDFIESFSPDAEIVMEDDGEGILLAALLGPLRQNASY